MTDVTQTQKLDELDEAIVQVEEQLGLVFGRARQFYKDASAAIHPELQPVGYKVLGAIVRLGETNAHALAELLDADKSMLSRQLRSLEDLGLVTSRPDDRDKRARVLSATPLALERVQGVRASRHDRLQELFRTHPVEDVRAFADMLHVLSGV